MVQKYIVLEIQVSDQVGMLTYSYDTENEALGKFHAILASAAESTLPCHTAIIVTGDGMILRTECIKHEVTE